MKSCIVVGGGLAGLSTSVYLSLKNYNVTLIEASPKFGGRTYSLYNSTYKDEYNNGQHIMMGCYKNTLDYLETIGSYNLLSIQPSLNITFVEEGGSQYQLKAPKYFYPFNLLIAILNYKTLSLGNRFKLVDFFLDLMCCFKDDLSKMTVVDWFLLKNQNDETISKLWETLVVGTMNTTPDKASAEIFYNVLKEVFLSGNSSTKIIIPNGGLSKLFVEPALLTLEKNNSGCVTSEKVESIVVSNSKVSKVITNKNSYQDFDALVLALPPHSLDKIKFLDDSNNEIVPLFKIHLSGFKYSSILNVHLWLNKNPFTKKFYGLIDSEIHWLFNNTKHINLTTSSADHLINLDNDEIMQDFYEELENYFPSFNRSMVESWKIIKEKRATFIPDYASNSLRKEIQSPYSNMFFAGDWTDTGFPSTIEGAVMSGKLASEKILNCFN